MTTNQELVEFVLLEEQGIEIQCNFHPDRGCKIWETKTKGVWDIKRFEYRRKPQPSEAWINEYASRTQGWAYSTPEKAITAAGSDAVRVAVHMREVVEVKSDDPS